MGTGINIIGILAAVFALAATVLAFIFIVPAKKRKSLNKLGKLIHDIVNFRFLIIEKILQALYIFATAYVIGTGFFMLFYVQNYWGYTKWYGGYGLLVMILGPIVIRLAYELLIMMVLLVKNVIQINNKIKSDGSNEVDAFAVPGMETYKEAPAASPIEPETVAQTDNTFCIYCGASLNGANFCPVCGKQANN